MGTRTLRVGMAGLGLASRQILPAFKHTPDVKLTAVADLREEALDDFRHRDGVKTFTSVEAMCASDDVDVVWIATPNPLHAEHSILAAENGKHVICEKPMAVTLEECQAMIEAIDKNNVKYVQGHSKIYNAPVRKMREIVASGELGRLVQVNNWYYKPWLQSPRLASEVDTSQGGGVVYRQGPHQTDVIRCIGGGMVKSVRAITGRWRPGFDTEGNYTAFLEFEDGTPATMVFNGYGRFHSSELVWGIGEGGEILDEDPLRRLRYSAPVKPEEKYALPQYAMERMERREEARKFQPFYGVTLVSCERGDIRQSPDGLYVYTDEGRTEIPTGKNAGHAAELMEMYEAVTEDRPSFPDARWGRATLELCLTIMKSSEERRELPLSYQVPCPI